LITAANSRAKAQFVEDLVGMPQSGFGNFGAPTMFVAAVDSVETITSSVGAAPIGGVALRANAPRPWHWKVASNRTSIV